MLAPNSAFEFIQFLTGLSLQANFKVDLSPKLIGIYIHPSGSLKVIDTSSPAPYVYATGCNMMF